jgi:hypothetical protein
VHDEIGSLDLIHELSKCRRMPDAFVERVKNDRIDGPESRHDLGERGAAEARQHENRNPDHTNAGHAAEGTSRV